MDYCNDVDFVLLRKYIYILSGFFFVGWFVLLLFFFDCDEGLCFVLK